MCQNSEYDQEIPQSQTADKTMAPRGWFMVCVFWRFRQTSHFSTARRKTHSSYLYGYGFAIQFWL